MRTFNPVAAFLIISVIVAAGLVAIVVPNMWGTGPDATFVWSRDAEWIFIIFLFVWGITLVAGMIVGLPLLFALSRLGWSRRAEALLPVGLIAGAVAAGLLGVVASSGSINFMDDPRLLELGAGAGLAAGALWWLLRGRQGATNG